MTKKGARIKRMLRNVDNEDKNANDTDAALRG